MSGGGGSSKVKYTSSPEQQQLYNAIMPMVQGLSDYGSERYFGGAPQMGAPSASGVFTGQQMYDIPDPTMAMPTANWYGSLAPEVKAGLYAPYVEAGQGISELMGSRGQMGSAGSGHTGAYGAAMGSLGADAAKNVGMSAWQMTSPMAMNAWQANLGRNMDAYQAGQQERLADYNTQMNVWNRPMGMTGMLGSSMPQAYAQPQSNQLGGAFSGGLMGAMGSSAFGMNPFIGGGLGALAGLFS